MNIRLGTVEDAKEIASVIHEMTELRSVTSRSIETTTLIIERNLQKAICSETSSIFVAESSEGEIAGYGAVHWIPFLFLPGGMAYLTELFIRPEKSGRGIGSSLLDRIVLEATERGCSRLSLVNGRGEDSYRRQFYSERGWVERKEMANFVLHLDKSSKTSKDRGRRR
jgi:GNAT superfamily N-acetyltransferase